MDRRVFIGAVGGAIATGASGCTQFQQPARVVSARYVPDDGVAVIVATVENTSPNEGRRVTVRGELFVGGDVVASNEQEVVVPAGGTTRVLILIEASARLQRRVDEYRATVVG